jgi:hypothetical protein
VGEGYGVWDATHYIPSLDAKLLYSIDQEPITIWPGTFRFYYEPQTRTLLSFEVVQRVNKNELQRALQSALNFTATDVAFNRAGKISERQQVAMRQTFLVVNTGTIALLSGFSVLLVLGLGLAMLMLPYNITTWLKLLGPVGFFLVILGFIAYTVWEQWGSLQQDLRSGTVKQLEGPLHAVRTIENGRRHQTVRYYFALKNGQAFHVSEIAYQALLNHERYRLYYIPHSKQILSLEVV